VALFTNSTIMGGMEEHVLQLGRGLAARGVRVGVICSDRPAIEPLRGGLLAGGVEVHALAESGGSPGGVARRLADLVNTFRSYPRCVLHLHSTGYRGADLVVLAARLAGARGVVRTMHLPPVEPVPNFDRLITPIRDTLVQRIICVAEQNRSEHIRLLGRDPRRCVVVHNGIDFARFTAPNPDDVDRVRREFGLDAGTPVVGTVSRLGEHRKGMSYFVEMAAHVVASVPTTRFLIVGEGELRADLERQASILGVADRIIFTGARQDVPRLLAVMRVFVNPSLWEAGPYTVLEAAALHVPVVSTPVGFVPEIILQDGCEGRMVPLGDSDALARAVVEVLSDSSAATRMAQMAYARIAEEFSVERMVDRLVEVYREVA
jgi:glycosyltransferase involved in cell wall biosynthesis